MEVLVGPTFGIEVSPSTPPAKHHQVAAAAAAPTTPAQKPAAPCLFVAEEEDGGSEGSPISSRDGSGVGFGLGLVKAAEDSSESSSSIGAPDDSDEDEEDDGTVVTSSSKDAMGSLDSLEEALPIKRGLSNHFSGKSKSFGNLADVTTSVNRVKDLEKPENPFNKRRRLLIANKLSRKSFYSWSNPKSMPLLTLKEDDDVDGYGDRDDDDEDDDRSPSSSSSSVTQEQGVLLQERHSRVPKLYQRRFGATFKSQSCFSLADLQEEEECYQ
ncbi:hypothetical protein Tsubulata_020005 [Turnera subulata]|uniref:Uncharacterized protein n=1 Tax=Turnera subulata TaxID=218843 RepID=A0A9Q0JBI5_9ROSI|nr:hypothetical protein Tsubulata_020005 [Turnera subulata]